MWNMGFDFIWVKYWNLGPEMLPIQQKSFFRSRWYLVSLLILQIHSRIQNYQEFLTFAMDPVFVTNIGFDQSNVFCLHVIENHLSWDGTVSGISMVGISK